MGQMVCRELTERMGCQEQMVCRELTVQMGCQELTELMVHREFKV